MVFESIRIVSREREEKIGSGHQVSYVPYVFVKMETLCMEGNYSHLPLSISIEFIFSLLPNYIQKQIIWKIN